MKLDPISTHLAENYALQEMDGRMPFDSGYNTENVITPMSEAFAVDEHLLNIWDNRCSPSHGSEGIPQGLSGNCEQEQVALFPSDCSQVNLLAAPTFDQQLTPRASQVGMRDADVMTDDCVMVASNNDFLLPDEDSQENMLDPWPITDLSLQPIDLNSLLSDSIMTTEVSPLYDHKLELESPTSSGPWPLDQGTTASEIIEPTRGEDGYDSVLEVEDKSGVGVSRSPPSRQSSDPSQPGNRRSERPKLACPYFKKNSRKHHGCGRYDLNRIKDVKQHIYRIHTRPDIYCPRCYDTFKKVMERDEHVRQADCRIQKRRPKWEGISEVQKEQLTRYSGRQQSVEEQWFAIWEVLFQGQAKPRSPYIDRRDRTLPLIRKFWDERRGEIIDGAVGVRPAVGHEEIGRVMESVFDSFEREYSLSGGSAGLASWAGKGGRRGSEGGPMTPCSTNYLGSVGSVSSDSQRSFDPEFDFGSFDTGVVCDPAHLEASPPDLDLDFSSDLWCENGI